MILFSSLAISGSLDSAARLNSGGSDISEDWLWADTPSWLSDSELDGSSLCNFNSNRDEEEDILGEDNDEENKFSGNTFEAKMKEFIFQKKEAMYKKQYEALCNALPWGPSYLCHILKTLKIE